MQKQVTEQEFMDLKKVMVDAEAARKVVQLNQIKIDADSFKNHTIEVNGARLNVDGNFFAKLSSLLKMNRSLTTEMLKNSDAKLAAQMMNGLKSYREARDGGNEIMLIADPKSRTVIDVCKPNQFKRISNESMFDLTERILNDKPNLSIETINFGPGGGVINLLNNTEIGFPGAGKDEYFKFGFSIIQDHRNTQIEMYNQRLICSNGLRTSLGAGAIGGNRDIQFNESFALKGNTADDVRLFIQNIDAMAKADFVPAAFGEVLETAANTKASLFEVENAMITAQMMVDERDVDLRNRYMQQLSKNYFTGHSLAMQRIARKGVNPVELNDRQKQLITTQMSIWDVVNSMTFLGSNNSGIPLDDQFTLKQKAGQLFSKGISKGYDLQYADFAQL